MCYKECEINVYWFSQFLSYNGDRTLIDAKKESRLIETETESESKCVRNVCSNEDEIGA